MNEYVVNIHCCYNCQIRHLGCHSDCESYITERKTLDAYNAMKVEKLHTESDLNGLVSMVKSKSKRTYNRNHGRKIND